jgi:glycosyltransferase involved in cell wall biosynthesis
MPATKPHILILIDWFLPGYKAGGPIKSCANLVDHLKEDYDFWVITRDTDYCETEPYPTIEPDTWNILEPHLQVFYVSAANLKYSTLLKAAQQASPDVVFINGIYSFYFSVLPLRFAKKIGCRTIVSVRGMLAPSAIQVKGGKKRLFLQAVRVMGLYKGVRFHATNAAEREHIKAVFGDKQVVYVAPNLAKPSASKIPVTNAKEKGVLKLVSIARVSPEKNTMFALQVLQNYSFIGSIEFDLYGPIYNENYWNDCLQIINFLPDTITVNYKGSIESSLVHTALQQYHLLFLPTRGENFGHVILESLSAGLPVLISDQTPWRRLEQEGVGYDLPLNEPDRFASAIQYMLDISANDYSLLASKAAAYATKLIQNPEAVAQNKAMFYS